MPGTALPSRVCSAQQADNPPALETARSRNQSPKKGSAKRREQVYNICDGAEDSLHHPQLDLLISLRTDVAPGWWKVS